MYEYVIHAYVYVLVLRVIIIKSLIKFNYWSCLEQIVTGANYNYIKLIIHELSKNKIILRLLTTVTRNTIELYNSMAEKF